MKQKRSYIKDLLDEYSGIQKELKSQRKMFKAHRSIVQKVACAENRVAFYLFVLNIARYAEKRGLKGTETLNLVIKQRVRRAAARFSNNGCPKMRVSLKNQDFCVNRSEEEVLLHFVKQCVNFILYNHPKQTFLDFSDTIPCKPCEITVVPDWITRDACMDMIRRKKIKATRRNPEREFNESYDPFHLYGRKKTRKNY